MTQPTLLPIYQFAKVLGLHPLHVMGVAYNLAYSSSSRVCIEPIQQYSWQDSDGVSREELAAAIAEAEQDLRRELGFNVMPTWAVDERVDIEQPAGAWFKRMYDARGDQFSVRAGTGLLISGGYRHKTLIQAGQAIVYTDGDGDGYAETATVAGVVLGGGITDTEEIAVYYPGLSGDDEWEIRPISVSIAAGVATITFRREQAVLKSLLERLDAGTVDGALAGNFLTTVDVYRKYHDPSVQAQIVWRGVASCSCAGLTSCQSCGLTIQNACLTVKDYKLGIATVTPAEWDTETLEFVYTSPSVCSRRPDYVRIWYRAGYRDMSLSSSYTTMSPRWQRAVAKLAISKLDRLICSCKGVSDVQSHWSADLRRSAASRGGSSVYKVTNYELENNPFGTTVAAMEVWRDVRRASLGIQGVGVGGVGGIG